ncbi:UDP-N-acetylmuramate dehydrogenase [Cytophagaceae bacterium DM2B3-1]|uniref:UDP-N-acetylenolpyruvoylglucosamine reductase n=1 Tax=Xanthocytophaga flava TaxID=3048013 RepID=A0ABT7D117_9BACT|nr:UDP-N-acetylmuramate dehydrogenase [Xanthocytophaga flavus]MDJ1471440.1 UDP-N-acetylmuramate dehydrogenase [Xanthocytophaga flavus]MDJ1498862.1 UDP-N-acetylmuramate dehydrogenase [Xanthocytophaga flavus]
MNENTTFHYEQNCSLKPFNTFGIEAQAHYLAKAEDIETLRDIITAEQFQNTPVLFLGGGSNVLFTKNYFEGLVVLMQIKGISVLKEDDTHVWLQVGAGEVWHEFVLECIKRNLGGVENLSLIPGTVGAAPMQNIGAYGVEIKDTFDSLEAVDRKTGQLRLFTNADCKFGYRESVFKHELKDQYIITSVTFRLVKNPTTYTISYGDIQKTLQEMEVQTPSLRTVSDAVIHIRQSKLPDPKQIGNAGSFFKNPVIPQDLFEQIQQQNPAIPSYPAESGYVKIPAGWLIEQAGWKGFRVGNVGVHTRQALVLVNYGNGTGEEIRHLSEIIQTSVKERFGVLLHTEVNFI